LSAAASMANRSPTLGTRPTPPGSCHAPRMLLRRILVFAIAAAYVGYRAYLRLALARARRRGDTERERALLARASWATRWALGTALAVVLFLVLLVVLNSRG
jgi:hypothetical protein